MAAVYLVQMGQGRARLFEDDCALSSSFKIQRLKEPGCLQKYFWSSVQVHIDGNSECVWIHRRSFLQSTGKKVEEVFSDWWQRCANARFMLRRLLSHRPPSEFLTRPPLREQQIVVASLNALLIPKPLKHSLERKVMDFSSQGFVCIPFNRKKYGDRPIGRGGFCEVDEGRLLRYQNGTWEILEVAISTMRIDRLNASDRKLYEEFRRVLPRIQALAGTPGIAAVYGSMEYTGKRGGEKFSLVMERLSKSLFVQFIQWNGGVWAKKEKREKNILELLMGVAALHKENIIHRDLKPENLLLSREGSLKIIDFGMCADYRRAVDHCGTMAYVAPEVLTRGGQWTFAGDVFSTGLILAEFYLKSFRDPPALREIDNAPRLQKSAAYARCLIAQLSADPLLNPDIFYTISRMLSEAPEERPTAAEALKTFAEIFAHNDVEEIGEFTAIDEPLLEESSI